MSIFKEKIMGLPILDYGLPEAKEGPRSIAWLRTRAKSGSTCFMILPYAFLLFFFLFQLLIPASAPAEKVILKIGTLAPEGSVWVKTFREINRELGQKTGNQVAIRIFPGGVLGDEEDMLRKVKIGQIQGGFFSGGGLGLIFKDIKIFAIPFLFQNYSEVDMTIDQLGPFFEKGISDNGFKLLAWGESGFIYLFSKHPVKNAADLRQGKVWIWEDTAMGRAVFKELRVNAVPLGIPDVLVALQTGMIDTVYASPTAAISMQWFTRVSYMTDVPLSYSVGALVLQRGAFEKIPPALREPVEEIFRRHLASLKKTVRQEDRRAITVLTKRGIKLVTPSTKEVREMQALCLKGVDTLGEDVFSKKTLTEVKTLLKNYRKEN
jgi:TRAP-type transport system periplasmic protein